MNRMYVTWVTIVTAVFLMSISAAHAGPPLTNAEGVGGVALNPMAYVANPLKEGDKGLFGAGIVSKPQFAVWYIGLNESHINWFPIGANISFFNRLELGYSHEFVDIEDFGNGDGQNVNKDNFSVKLNLIRENEFDLKFMPAFSFGAIYMHTDADDSLELKDNSDWDFYFVATKMIKELPLPVILNAGTRATKGFVRGVLGFGDDRQWTFFGNIDTVLFDKFIVGWEYQQDIDVGDVFKGESGADHSTHSMWEAHVAFMYDEHLTLVGSYAYTGDKDSVSQASFGNALVLSMHYAF